MRRVVITGLGLVTPLGATVQSTWKRLINAESGIKEIDIFDISDMPAKIAGLVPQGNLGVEGNFNADDYLSPKDQKKVDRFILYGLAAAVEAVEDSGWKPQDDESCFRTGVMVGSGIGGLPRIYDTSIILHEGGPKKVSPFFIPASLINLTSGQIAMRYNFKGPNHSVVTACSTGGHAISDAARLIQMGDADVMVAGGAEAAVCRIGVAGFAALRALSTNFNETPQKASRPWDKNRDGFVMGEGAGIVILEEYEHAKRRGAKIYAEILGGGLSGDAYHITAPAPDGNGAYRAMQAALKRAQINLDQVDYINAHGTSTPMGDEIELGAVKRLFGEKVKNLSMSSTKSAIGHLLGAAGGVEAVFAILSIQDSVVPPTLNLDDPCEGAEEVDLVPHQAKQRRVKYALSNAFGFGGTNSSLVFGAIE
ncbi:beta-ketoacyl-ACP synthase II [Candidatus Nucleicultrix amoebiphila]|jgi:3-oxoacyl-[acyl-carrier-protein] synthase II|uniref:3-oxoacyl-[acyl-carrier-protein] synthase 2 n=1 Tax=Candidatus Nucleicultrix amoebiphila FS5 TaxID=1414854 RepID=A0A1W6N5T0_9PROT|nr:beta-ketoacyl-ACP synthase II [Candidatus Nucleicultrix amoebiphila]ARN85240.1 3-oxoacyl-ACP synthase [Candidatus Nucleicultrix amoebiphila FS5]